MSPQSRGPFLRPASGGAPSEILILAAIAMHRCRAYRFPRASLHPALEWVATHENCAVKSWSARTRARVSYCQSMSQCARLAICAVAAATHRGQCMFSSGDRSTRYCPVTLHRCSTAGLWMLGNEIELTGGTRRCGVHIESVVQRRDQQLFIPNHSARRRGPTIGASGEVLWASASPKPSCSEAKRFR